MKYLGWILAGLFLTIIILNQLTINEYRLACEDYRKAINIYEGIDLRNNKASELDSLPITEKIKEIMIDPEKNNIEVFLNINNQTRR